MPDDADAAVSSSSNGGRSVILGVVVVVVVVVVGFVGGCSIALSRMGCGGLPGCDAIDMKAVAQLEQERREQCVFAPPVELADAVYEGLRWDEEIYIQLHDRNVAVTGLGNVVVAPVGEADEAWVVVATVFASNLLTEDLSYTDAAWIAEGSLTTPTLISFSHSAEQLSRFPKHAATLSQWAQVEAREAAEFCAARSTRREIYRQGHPGRVTIRHKDDAIPNWYDGWVEIIERW